MRFDPTSLTILADDGKPIGHVIDAIRSGLVDASECKALLDHAWIAREQAHADAVAVLTAKADGQIAAMQAAIDERDTRLAAPKPSPQDSIL